MALHVNELIQQYHQAQENYRKSCERVRDLAIQCTGIDFRNINKIYEAIIISEKYCDSLKQKINDLKNIFNYYERSNADIFKRTSTLEKTIAYYKTLIIEREKEISKYVSHLVSLKPDLKALAYRCGINTQSIDEKVNHFLQAQKESQQSQSQKNIQQQKATLKFPNVPNNNDEDKNEKKKNEKSLEIYDKNGQDKHIFRNEPGHLQDTTENRNLLIDVASDSKNFLGMDKFGNQWFAKTLANGKQIWALVRNNIIRNGGLNDTPKIYNPKTGLSSIGKS